MDLQAPDYRPDGSDFFADRRPEFVGDGFAIIDKPVGMTSHDVVGKMRRLCATRKIGHAGTLDPDATGILIIGVGAMTRALTYLSGWDKTYTAAIRLGITTTTEDGAGEITAATGCDPAPTAARLERVLAEMVGEQLQVPSAVSAKRVGGVRAHELVRAGHSVDLAPCPVTFHALELMGRPEAVTVPVPDLGPIQCLDFKLRVHCSAGTFIRALARDIGAALGCGGHVQALRRTGVGPFTITQAQPLPAFGGDPIPLLDPATFLTQVMPTHTIDAATVARVRNGMAIACTQPPTGPIALIGPAGVVAIAAATPRRDGLRPRTVFATSG